jgi:hypothetical protein
MVTKADKQAIKAFTGRTPRALKPWWMQKLLRLLGL